MRKKVWMWEFILFFSLAVVLCGCGKTVTTTNDSGVSDDVLRGYKTIDGKLYRFDENGVSVEGLYEENGFYYLFENTSSGKAAAVSSESREVNGDIYYFSESGKGFLSTQNPAVDKALGKFFSRNPMEKKADKKEYLESCYRALLQECSYLGVGTPSFQHGWQFVQVKEMLERHRGNCFSYATACGMIAHALGFDVQIMTGKCKREGGRFGEHSWVLIDNRYVLDGVFEDVANNGEGKLSFFWKDYESLEADCDCEYKADKSWKAEMEG